MHIGQRLPFSLKRHRFISATTKPYHWIQSCLNLMSPFLSPVLMSLKYVRFGDKNKHVKGDYLLIFFAWVHSPSGPRPPDRLISRSQSDTLRSVGLLCTSDRPIAQTLPDNTHNTQDRRTTMPPAAEIPASKRPKTHVLDRTPTGTGIEDLQSLTLLCWT
jgi:hypothetical protein